jgi:hypothetical protein
MHFAARSARRPTSAGTGDRKTGPLVPMMWGLGLLAVALVGTPGRSLDVLFDRLALLQPSVLEPAAFTGMLLVGIPVIMLAAILISIAVCRE